MVAGDIVKEFLAWFWKGSVGGRRGGGVGEDEHDGEEERGGEEEWPEIGQEGEEPWGQDDERDEGETEDQGEEDVILELEQLFLDLHGRE